MKLETERKECRNWKKKETEPMASSQIYFLVCLSGKDLRWCNFYVHFSLVSSYPKGKQKKKMNAGLRSRILFLSQWISVCKKQEKVVSYPSYELTYQSAFKFYTIPSIIFFKCRVLICDYQVNSNIRENPWHQTLPRFPLTIS